MNYRKKRDRWLRDAQTSQRNTVFPYTLVNEVRFWRNLAGAKPTTKTKIGLLILVLFVSGFAVAIIRIFSDAGTLWWVALALTMLVVWGSIFAVIVWGTKRSLRRIESAHHNSKERWD